MNKRWLNSIFIGKIIILIDLVFLIGWFGYLYTQRPPKRMFDALNLSEVLDMIITWRFLFVLILNIVYFYYAWIMKENSKRKDWLGGSIIFSVILWGLEFVKGNFTLRSFIGVAIIILFISIIRFIIKLIIKIIIWIWINLYRKIINLKK